MTATTVLAILAGIIVLIGLFILGLNMKEVPPELIGPHEDADGNPIPPTRGGANRPPKKRKSYLITLSYFVIDKDTGGKKPGTDWYVTACYSWDDKGKRSFSLTGRPRNIEAHQVEGYVKQTVQRLSPEVIVLGEMWVNNAITEMPATIDGQSVKVLG